MKYLSLDGVNYLWSKIKSVFIKKSDVLTYEEIQASTDLTGKVASANVVGRINLRYSFSLAANSSGTIDISAFSTVPFLILTSGTENALLFMSVWIAAKGSINPKALEISNAYGSIAIDVTNDKLTIYNKTQYRQVVVVTILGGANPS